ncbi:MAG TPA: dethiobiotin synthase [Thermoanaerobaculia bacterium]|nr:dethiobiotin synthase [Thermoanaerobaculia bacterium]
MSLAVVGTGTGVGKTVVSAVLLARFKGILPLAYWKPVATGAREGRDTATVGELCGPAVEVLPESYLFQEPLSPHLAARLEGAEIAPALLLAELARHRGEGRRGLVVEGVGGLLVPFTDAGYLLADFLVAAELPCLLVAASGLGTINHTLLTLEALRARRLAVAGVVLAGPPNAENRRSIERLGAVPVVAEVAPLPAVDRAAVAGAARGFDPAGRLEPYLRA